MNCIKINNIEIPHPLNFAMQPAPNINNEYVTLDGETVADICGYKYADVTLEWEYLKESDLQNLLTQTNTSSGLFDFTYEDVEDGVKTIKAYRTSLTTQETRSRDANNNIIWRNIKMGVTFPNSTGYTLQAAEGGSY